MYSKMMRAIFLVLALAFFTAACGQLAAGVVTPMPTGLPPEVSPPTGEATPTSDLQEATATLVPATAEPTDAALPLEAAYWVDVLDERTGVRFTIPCFWIAHLPTPEQDPTGLGAFFISNYPDDYVFNFPRSQIPEDAGAIKIDMLFWRVADWGQDPGVSLEEFAANIGGEEVRLLATEAVQINGQPAVLVTTESTFGIGQYYLFRLNDEVLFGFAAGDDLENPDVQGILNSLALSEEVEVRNPGILPGAPPAGLAGPCVPGYEVIIPPTVVVPPENTACGLDSYLDLDTLIQSVQTRLQARNTGGLRWEYYIHDPFMLAYWRSEGLVVSPDEMATTLANSLYNAAEPGGMTFTTDRSEFPSLEGTTPEALINPDIPIAEIVYSEGWGQDGRGAALLYFAQDECGGYYWYGLLFAGDHFE